MDGASSAAAIAKGLISLQSVQALQQQQSNNTTELVQNPSDANRTLTRTADKGSKACDDVVSLVAAGDVGLDTDQFCEGSEEIWVDENTSDVETVEDARLLIQEIRENRGVDNMVVPKANKISMLKI
jgi:hypothetical protein